MKKELITHCVIDEEQGIKYEHSQNTLFICIETKESICLHCLESIYEDKYYLENINEMPMYVKVLDGFLRAVSIPQRAIDLEIKSLEEEIMQKQDDIDCRNKQIQELLK